MLVSTLRDKQLDVKSILTSTDDQKQKLMHKASDMQLWSDTLVTKYCRLQIRITFLFFPLCFCSDRLCDKLLLYLMALCA